MKGYKHITWNDRIYLEKLLRLGYKKSDIANIIGCSLATVYNELKRGTYDHLNTDLTTTKKYAADIANDKYINHLKSKGQTEKILKDAKLCEYIRTMIIEQNFSPEAVLMEIKNNNLKFEVEIKSAQTIYAAIRKGYIKDVSMKNLPRKGKTKKKKQKVEALPAYWREQKGNSIEDRPDTINSREEFGHWEMDSVIGKSVNKKTALVLTERKTRTELVECMKFHTMKEVVRALNRIEKRMGADFYKIFKSITVDNGSEFKDFKGMQKALRRKGDRTVIYYCHARSPQERGSNENNNILLRRCKGLNKGSDFDATLSHNICKNAEFWINTYPRKILGGKCSLELFNEELDALGCKPLY